MVCCSLKIPIPSYVAAWRMLCTVRKNITLTKFASDTKLEGVINMWESRATVKRDVSKVEEGPTGAPPGSTDKHI